MKIALIGPVYPYRGGIAHYTTSLSIALRNAGHEVSVFSFKRQYPAFLYPGESDKDPSADPIRVDAYYLLDPMYPWDWLRTGRAILKSRSELVVFQWWTTFWGPAYAVLNFLLQKQVPIVYLVHNVLPHENRAGDKWIAKLALGKASAFIVQTKNEQKRLLDLIPHAKISYCGHPVYPRFNDQTVSKEVARQQLDLPVDKPVLLFFGIVRPYKGLKHLIAAMAQSDPSVNLVVAGEFWENVDGYQDQINALGLTRRVTLINKYLPNEEAHLFFSAADAVIVPYVGGTQSGVAELALGYGLPIIVSDRVVSGIDVQDSSSLLVVPAGDPAALATAIDELVRTHQDLPLAQPEPNDWNRMVETIEKTRFLLLNNAI